MFGIIKVNASVRHFVLQTHTEAGVPSEGADPYPRPPIPVFDSREIRDRVEKWQANVLSAPLSQADNHNSELNQPPHVKDGERPLPLNFPTVKRRKSDVVKAMKRKRNPSRKNHSTSRYFPRIADPTFSESANRNNEGVFPTCSLPCGSPTPATPPSQENIRQVSEVRRIPVSILSPSADDFPVIFATVFPFSTSNIHAAPAFRCKKRPSPTDETPSDSTDRGPVSHRFSPFSSTVSPLARNKQGLRIRVPI